MIADEMREALMYRLMIRNAFCEVCHEPFAHDQMAALRLSNREVRHPRPRRVLGAVPMTDRPDWTSGYVESQATRRRGTVACRHAAHVRSRASHDLHRGQRLHRGVLNAVRRCRGRGVPPLARRAARMGTTHDDARKRVPR